MAVTQQDRVQLEQVLRSVEASLTAAAGQIIHDGPVREAYIREVRRAVGDIRRRFETGAITVRFAAEEASTMRNIALENLRAQTSPLGKAIAKNLKDQGKTLNDLIAKYTIELHGPRAQFPHLSQQQQNRIYATILEKAGQPNMNVTTILRRLQPAARGLVVIGLGYSIYTVATAENKGKALAREGASLGAGILGGAAGGAAAGLLCGPGAPVCVTVGAFVGGALAAFGVEMAFGR